ncbi:hypothetical protein K6W36_09200 [Acetobacter senegalensis]|uniref:hypothetical protein n=1 Tax=Acetobacter senegalensis TaxID=446692 RepID=UPI001EDADDB3|nr:hypothetical protein [Acetobacter senegalensis]MCG4260762.1 hypothetical protein [Acetobacter senegalensis]
MRWSNVLREQIHLNTAKALSSAALHEMVADQCRQNRDEFIAQGKVSPVYTTYVDGKRDTAEEAVMLQGGIVTYIFSALAQAANWALDQCRKRSPVRSGAYRDSWVILVDGVAWQQAPAKIPKGSTVWIVNTMPYARKIEVGGMRVSVPPGIVEAVRQATQRRFGSIRADKAYKPLQGGRDARGEPIPYVLRQAGIASGMSWDKKSKTWSRKHAAYASNRADRQAGQQMLYPTLILTEPGQ